MVTTSYPEVGDPVAPQVPELVPDQRSVGDRVIAEILESYARNNYLAAPGSLISRHPTRRQSQAAVCAMGAYHFPRGAESYIAGDYPLRCGLTAYAFDKVAYLLMLSGGTPDIDCIRQMYSRDYGETGLSDRSVESLRVGYEVAVAMYQQGKLVSA